MMPSSMAAATMWRRASSIIPCIRCARPTFAPDRRVAHASRLALPAFQSFHSSALIRAEQPADNNDVDKDEDEGELEVATLGEKRAGRPDSDHVYDQAPLNTPDNYVEHPDGSVSFDVTPRNISDAFEDPTAFNESITAINTRLMEKKPLTVNQRIVLLKSWLTKLEENPRTVFEPHPLITWTHPNEKGSRPDRHPPRMEEKFVPYEFSSDIVKSMTREERFKSRRGSISEFLLARQVYELKMNVVRKHYQTEYLRAKAKREAAILKEWKATKAAKMLRLEAKSQRQETEKSTRQEHLKHDFETRLLKKKQLAEARLQQEFEYARRKAEILETLVVERQQVLSATGSGDSDSGLKIDDSLFHRTERYLVGFWPERRD